jgi:hypothetical protein
MTIARARFRLRESSFWDPVHNVRGPYSYRLKETAQ